MWVNREGNRDVPEHARQSFIGFCDQLQQYPQAPFNLASLKRMGRPLTKPLFCTRLVFAGDDDVSAVCTHLLSVFLVCRNRKNLARAVSLCDVFLRDSKGSEQNEPANRKWMPVRIVCRPRLQPGVFN